MYHKWIDYRADRAGRDLDAKIDRLCEAVALSGLPFSEWWAKHALPALLAERYENVDQLLTEAWYNPATWFGGSAPAVQPVGPGDAGGAMQGKPSDAGRELDRGFSADTQAKINAAAASVKQELRRALHGIVSQMKTNRDSIGFQVANILSQRLDGQVDQVVKGLKRGENKFDREKAFGPAPATQNVGDRWQSQATTEAGQQRMAQIYSQKLGVPPETIMKLINAGFTNPSLWPGMIKAQQAGVPQAAAPAGAAPLMQDNPDDPEAIRMKQRLAGFAPQAKAAMRKMMQKFMAKR